MTYSDRLVVRGIKKEKLGETKKRGRKGEGKKGETKRVCQYKRSRK